MRKRRSPSVVHVVVGLAAFAAACSEKPPDEQPPETSTSAPTGSALPTPEAGPGRTYERNMVLLSPETDTLPAVAWLFTARPDSTGVARTARAYVLHGGALESLYEENWEEPPIREPWRILPHGGLRVLVGLGDVLERVVLDEPPVYAELGLGEVLVEWSGPRGGTYHLVEGEMVLGDRTVSGLGLDMARSWTVEGTPYGDWAFLVSGDSLQVVLHSPTNRPPGSGAWRGWGRIDFRDLRWPVLTMQWTEVRSYGPARRDVPVEWSLSAPDGEVTVELAATATHLEAGEGSGAQLPVRGLFGVSGTLTFEGRLYPVRGMLRHVQP